MRVWKNNANSILAISINETDTTITVEAGTGDVFPVADVPDYFFVTLTDESGAVEIVRVGYRSAGSDTMYVDRAQENTIARAWNANTTLVSLRLTAAALNSYEAHINASLAAHPASAISSLPTGSVTATNVQGAINQLEAAVRNLGISGGGSSSGSQSLDPTLIALAALDNNAGFIVQTGADAFTKRNLDSGVGISVTNSNGVDGNPTIALSDPKLLSLVTLTPSADTLLYFSSATTVAVSPLTEFARSLLDDVDAATARETLNAQETLVSGTNIKTINGTSLLGSGDLAIGGATDGFKNLRVFTVSGSWVKPTGLKRIKVIVIGGGGGGAGGYAIGTNNFGGNGGGGGGTAIKVIEASALGNEETVVVGTGGAGGINGSNGSNGGASSFGSHCSASGGGGAIANANGHAVGGQGNGGDLNLNGEYGSFGTYGPSDSFNNFAIGGKGGDSLLGKGGIGGNLSYNGFDGQYGGGGGGGSRTGNGGNGGSGLVIVEEYF